MEDEIVNLSELYSDAQLRAWAIKVPSSDMIQELMAELLRIEDDERDTAALTEMSVVDPDDEGERYDWCEDRERFKALATPNINRRTTIRLPTLEEWKAAVDGDQDLKKVNTRWRTMFRWYGAVPYEQIYLNGHIITSGCGEVWKWRM